MALFININWVDPGESHPEAIGKPLRRVRVLVRR